MEELTSLLNKTLEHYQSIQHKDYVVDPAIPNIDINCLEGLQPRFKSLCHQGLRKVVSQNMRDYYQ